MLAIGDFSRITHLSIRTLRHYHEVGLLEPAAIDPSSGYRHYTLDQVPIAQVIRRFRDLDMPVERVREILAAPDLATRNELIADHLGALESKLAQTQASVATLRGLLQPEAAPIVVELRKVPATRALAIHATVARSELVAWWRGALGELEATCDAQRLVRTGASGGIFAMEIFELERGEATMFVPIAGDAQPVGRCAMATIPAAELAITQHRGAHDDLDVVYGALGAYITAHAIGVDGPVRESYLVDPRRPSADWHTEIGWPVFGVR
jgi:DNA-binding transcriptional MerR regulator